MSKPVFSYKEERRKKNNFYASDMGRLSIDIILGLNGVEPSNPMDWNDYLKMSAGKGVELQMLKVLKQNGIVDEDYDQETEISALGDTVERDSLKIEREGIVVSMRFDAQVKDGGAKMEALDSILPNSTAEVMLGEGEPIEIKSINNKNSIDIQKYIDNKPKESYVMQLAVYMDALEKDQGHLFVSSIDGLNYFWFVCRKIGEGKYQCGDTIVDIGAEYKRFAELATVAKRIWDYPIMKKYWEEVQYKTPLDKIDWTKMSVSAIGEVRNGRKVVGDNENHWKVLYSPYKDIIVRLQGHTLGYTEEELNTIRTMTAGFSSKAKVAKPVEAIA